MGKCFLYKSGGGELVEDLPEDAILALENKGVTVSPEQAKIGNLANLINKIEKPQTFQIKVGEVTTSSSRATKINVGFKPDIIQFSKSQSEKSGNVSYVYSAAMDFSNHYTSSANKITDFSSKKVVATIMFLSSSPYYIDIEAYPDSNGFYIETYEYNESDYDYTTPYSTKLTYTAIKYTE